MHVCERSLRGKECKVQMPNLTGPRDSIEANSSTSSDVIPEVCPLGSLDSLGNHDIDEDDMKESRLMNLLDSASDYFYSLFYCGYRSLFVDTYQFEDFVFYSLWMLCLHFCITEKLPNIVRASH
ncbi:uncharacterized protein LOC135396379 [Ornithodoros turicata]|uniref:uncharacterized protein LOC135396379 n=1 Tax=Ornithodoros turicata TaxID=34597 RepID=UPI003139EB05